MSTIDAVLSHYTQISRGRRRVTRMAGGTNTPPWLICTSLGPVVLRRLPDSLSPARAEFVGAVHAYAAHGLKVVPDVMTNNNGDVVTEHHSHRYLLAHYAAGAPLPPHAPTPTQSHQLGSVLGQLHHQLRQMPLPTKVPTQELPADLTARIRAAIDNHQQPGCTHRSARHALADKLHRAQKLAPARLGDLRVLPVTLIHGDFHPGNVLTVDDSVTGILDFDLARLAPPAYELARALLYCTRPAGPVSVFAPRVAAFLTGYLAAAPLTDHELATMAELYETTQILDTHGLAVCEEATPDYLAFGQARFALLYWLRRNANTLTELALRAHKVSTTEGGPW